MNNTSVTPQLKTGDSLAHSVERSGSDHPVRPHISAREVYSI